MKFLSLIASALLLIAAPAAAEFKIATVDLNRILNESAFAKSQRKTLDSLSAQAKTKIETKRTSITAMEKKIRQVLEALGASNVAVSVQDNGALDLVLGARVEAAYRRFAGGEAR